MVIGDERPGGSQKLIDFLPLEIDRCVVGLVPGPEAGFSGLRYKIVLVLSQVSQKGDIKCFAEFIGHVSLHVNKLGRILAFRIE